MKRGGPLHLVPDAEQPTKTPAGLLDNAVPLLRDASVAARLALRCGDVRTDIRRSSGVISPSAGGKASFSVSKDGDASRGRPMRRGGFDTWTREGAMGESGAERIPEVDNEVKARVFDALTDAMEKAPEVGFDRATITLRLLDFLGLFRQSALLEEERDRFQALVDAMTYRAP
jgi:hypothetical protein